jgi:hypothetical protein
LLAPVYGWFTEGFDTRDPKEAKALLGEWADAALLARVGFGDRGIGDVNLQNSRGITLSVSKREVAWRNIGVMLGRVDAA